jgi:uncharacterized protein with PIN domain
MFLISLRFYAELNDFLPPHRRSVRFTHWLKESGAVKDTIEALGVPHPEVGLILVNQESVGFSYQVQAGNRISVYPQFRTIDVTDFSQVQPPPLPWVRFVLDVHLGKLANYLRLLGFDALYRNDYADDELAALSSQQQRILLTQDRALLKRRVITYGYCVRSILPLDQIQEVVQRFQLAGQICPLSRCLRCNGLLQPTAKASVYDRLPPLTRRYYDRFSACQSCGQIYWQGAHYGRIQQLIEQSAGRPAGR